MSAQRYWLTVASKDHVALGMAGGFMQACHGKQAPLKRIRPGDGLVFYSPRQAMHGGESCQAFTALGYAADEAVYSFNMSEGFEPFRRNIHFCPAGEAAIKPLVEQLEFIKDKQHWGYAFRFGFFEISERDFNFIASKMGSYEKAGQQYLPV